MSYEIIAAIVSALATTLAGALPLIARRSKKVVTGAQLIAAAYVAEERRDYRDEVRLSEVEQALDEEETRKTLYRYAAASLVIGQFIVGGVLTSSFVTRTFSEPIIGLLGLLVLASSLVNQHFRPDLLHKASVVKVYRLRALKRWTEDELFGITRTEVSDSRLLELRRRVTAALQEIEQADLQFLDDKGKGA